MFMKQMKDNQGVLDIKPMFSFYFSKGKNILLFGDYDLNKYAKSGSHEGDIKWFENSVQNSVSWVQQLSSVVLAGSANIIDDPSNTFFVADSGTTDAVIPSLDLFKLINALINKQIYCEITS